MFKLILILITSGAGVSGVQIGGGVYYSHLDLCFAAGKEAQNNLVGSLYGLASEIAFTCVPTEPAIGNREVHQTQKEED